jgi:pyruvate/2-oxoglutarate/acetoin dehydrogenase E1 component
MPSDAQNLSVKQAVLSAMFEEMEADPNVILLGEDIGAAGGVFKQTVGLFERFGAARIIDTPISESAIFGLAVGAAMTGSRPIVEIMFGDFITLVMDQLVNQAAKVHYMSAGGYAVPLVLKTGIGVGGNLGAQHSQSLHAWLAHIPGLKVVMPATAADAKGLMKAAIRDNNPVIFAEDRMSYNILGPVPAGEHLVPLGKADIKRQGGDLTIVAISRMVHTALAAAETLAGRNIDAEVVDLRCLAPLDMETVLASVKKTGRALVLDGAHLSFGITGEIAASIAETAFDYLDAPVMRLAAPDHPVPYSPALEQSSVPGAEQVIAKVDAMLGLAA